MLPGRKFFLRHDPQLDTASGKDGSYPPLQELILRDIDWSEAAAMAVCKWTCWSHLRRLELRSGEASKLLNLLLPARETLPSLEEFRMGMKYVSSESRDEYVVLVSQFLESTASGLRGLHLEAPWESLLPMILEKHGPTLYSLAIHDQPSVQEEERAILSLDDVVSVSTRCVELKHLSLDLDSEFTLRGSQSSEVRTYPAKILCPYV